MKQMIRNLVALSLLFAYTISISVSIQNFIVETVFDNSQQQDVAVNLLNSKTPELSIFPDLEPLGDLADENVHKVQVTNFKKPFQFFKEVEIYTLTKDNQYLYKSKHIQPGLGIETLLYPFHTFS